MPRKLWNQKVNYQVHNTAQPCQSLPLSSIPILILCLLSCLGFPIGLSASDFSISKACKHFYSFPCVLRTQPFACPFISSKKSTNQQAPHYAVLPSLPLLPLSKDARRIFLITLLSATLSLFPSLSTRKFFHATTEQIPKIFISTFIERRQEESKITNTNAASIP